MCFWPLNMHFAKIRSCYIRGFALNMFRGQRHIGGYSFKMLHVDPNPISMGHLFAGCRDLNNSLTFKNNVKHNNLTIYHLFQSLTQNQYYRHPTHSP